MIRKTGNRAFAALNRILSLPGSQALGDIDISVAQPTYDLRDSAKAELSRNWLFQREFEALGGGGTETEDVNLQFHEASHWTEISTDGFTGGAIADPNEFGKLLERDKWVWGIGVQTTAPAAFTRASVTREYQLAGSPLFSVARQLLWRANTAQAQTGPSWDNGPSLISPLPWFFPASAGLQEFLNFAVTVSTGDSDVSVSFRVTSAVPGLFPFR